MPSGSYFQVKLLHVVSSPEFAGVERYITYIAPRLVARGCDVIVAGGNQATMRTELEGTGVGHVSARNVVEAALRVAHGRHVDVIHAHMTSADWAVVVNRPISRAALVSTRHFAARRGRRPVVRRLSRRIPKFLDEQIAISGYVASAIGEPSVVLPSGVPVIGIQRERQHSVLMLQRLEREKDSVLALEAWALSRARHRGWRLLVAGRGAEEAELRRKSSSTGLDDSVVFLGHQPDVAELLGCAGMLLATTPIEAFGLSVVEAMAAGLPVVAAAAGGHLETVGSGTTEYLFAPGDASDCAARLDSLIADDAARAAYGKKLQAHQRAHFDIERHVDDLLALYQRVVKDRRSRRPSRTSLPR